MPSIERTIQVSWRHQVFFTQHVFAAANPVLLEVLTKDGGRSRHKVLIILDEALAQAQAGLVAKIENYFATFATRLQLVCPPLIIEGGERTKNSYFQDRKSVV